MTDTTENSGLEAAQADETDPTEVDAPDTEHEAAQDDPGEQADGDEAPDNTNRDAREAAKYRRKLRATEAERDQLAARLEALQRAEVERQAAAVLADPADVWVVGTTMADLINDNGDVDTDKVKAALDGITKTRPHWKRPARRTPTTDGLRSGASGNQLPGTTSWAAAINGE